MYTTMPQVTYQMPAQYVISPTTAPAAASVEVAPAEGVTYTMAPTPQYYIQPAEAAPVTYAAAPAPAVATPGYTMGQSYTYIDYENASFVELAPVLVEAAPVAEPVATTAAAATTVV